MFTKREYGRIGELSYWDTLDNGLRIVVVPKRDYKRSLAFLAVNYGGADRRFKLRGEWHDTPAGVAHFLEHKMFELENGEDAMTVMSRRGANVNAFTASDMTAYHFDCVDGFYENLETLVSFVSTPHFTEESVEREKGIIAQEIKMGEDDPDHAVYYGLLRGLFKRHPMREAVVGTVESIAEITAETLRFCHSAFYVPANMTLVVVGNQDPIKVRTAVEGLLPGENRGVPERDYGRESEKPAKPRQTEKMDVAETIFLAGAKTEQGLRGTEGVKFDLTAALSLNTLLSEASPLYSEMYAEGLINETFSYDFEASNGVSFLSFGGETDRPDEVIKRVLEGAKKLEREGIPAAYFARRKKAALGDELRALNSFDNIAYNVALGAAAGYDYFETAPIMKDITEEDVRGFLGKWLTEDRLSMSVIEKREVR